VTFCNLKLDQLTQDKLVAKPSPKKSTVGRPKKDKGKAGQEESSKDQVGSKSKKTKK
jgi:hypothetical protein